ncbi:Sodium-dependent serotonin transporter [Trichinella sp. T6]|nr:Sodium-dependent serotonin transporter [Trichinella sp. T6]
MRMHFHMETTGVGYATCLIDVYMGCFYNTIISWALFYLSSSFKWPFPWQSCDNVWNTENCVPDNANVSLGNASSNYTNAAEEFFLRRVLEIQNSDGLDNLGNIRWPLLLCLLVIYTIVYFAIWRRPLSSGKVNIREGNFLTVAISISFLTISGSVVHCNGFICCAVRFACT